MEEQNRLQTEIENIIMDNTYPAKEITSHVFEFIEWMVKDQEVFYGSLSEGYLLKDDIRETKLEDIYQYWLKEVKHGE